jgi:hypothetical protein
MSFLFGAEDPFDRFDRYQRHGIVPSLGWIDMEGCIGAVLPSDNSAIIPNIADLFVRNPVFEDG